MHGVNLFNVFFLNWCTQINDPVTTTFVFEEGTEAVIDFDITDDANLQLSPFWHHLDFIK